MSVSMREHKEEELSKLIHARFTAEIDLQERLRINEYRCPGIGYPSIEWYEDEYEKACKRVEAFKIRNAEYFI